MKNIEEMEGTQKESQIYKLFQFQVTKNYALFLTSDKETPRTIVVTYDSLKLKKHCVKPTFFMSTVSSICLK